MRISGGEARGVKLAVPKGTRPASERVRLAIFSSLAAHVPDARVLDLYCGSGAYGLEALSRGASHAVFVDRSTDAVASVSRNARAAKLDGRTTVHRRDVRAYLADAGSDGPFDLVFADPPYDEEDVVPTVLSGLEDHVTAGGAVVAETRWDGLDPPTSSAYVLEAGRRYGDTRVLVYRRTEEET